MLTVVFFYFFLDFAQYQEMDQELYAVKRVENNDIGILKLSNEKWEGANMLSNFKQPWAQQESKETMFRALHDNRYLYLQYTVADENILLYQGNGFKSDVAQSDRVEIFLRRDRGLKRYYCLEIDPSKRVLDYSASFYREFNTDWTWPKGHLWIDCEETPEGYRIDVALSKDSLRDLGLINGNRIEVGIFRGDCVSLPTNEYQESMINWVTWVDPNTKEPDFHVPSSFGVLKLE